MRELTIDEMEMVSGGDGPLVEDPIIVTAPAPQRGFSDLWAFVGTGAVGFVGAAIGGAEGLILGGVALDVSFLVAYANAVNDQAAYDRWVLGVFEQCTNGSDSACYIWDNVINTNQTATG